MSHEALEKIVEEAVGELYSDPEQPDVLTEEEIAGTVRASCRKAVSMLASELRRSVKAPSMATARSVATCIDAELKKWLGEGGQA